MLTELPTWANLGPVKGGVEVGDPTRIRITQNLYGLPSFQLDQKRLTPRGFLKDGRGTRACRLRIEAICPPS